MRVIFTAAIFFLCSISAAAQKIDSCDLAVSVADRHSGVNIRADAGLRFGVVTTIPRDPRGTLVYVDGSKGEWVKVTRAINSKKAAVFSGVGWVYGPLLSVKTSGADDDLVLYYRNPRTETEEMGRIRSELDVILQGCSGDWVKVLIPKRGTEGIPAWLPHGSYCGSPWEDCS